MPAVLTPFGDLSLCNPSKLYYIYVTLFLLLELAPLTLE